MSVKEIEIVIEGGTPAQQTVLTSLAMNALTGVGFKDAHQVDRAGNERPYNADSQKLTLPSVMDYMRANSPELFVTPVIVSAYTPPPFEPERRTVDRVRLNALHVAAAYADVDPDEEWNNLDDDQKQQILRLADSRAASYAF